MTKKHRYPSDSLFELAGLYAFVLYRVNKEITEKGLDHTEVWDLINQEYDELTAEVRSESEVTDNSDIITDEVEEAEWYAELISGEQWTFVGVITEGVVEPTFILESYGEWLSVTSDEIAMITKD